MLFIRDFTGFTGGHLKVAHYLRHTAASGVARPVLYQTPRSRMAPDNPFNDHEGATTDTLRPFSSYFVAGLDWFRLDEAGIAPGEAPVVNLIQDFRFADSRDPAFSCLARPAMRICVSSVLADAIRGHANGEVHAIPNCIEINPVPSCRPLDASPRVFIAGLKQPGLARVLAAKLVETVEVDLVTDLLPRRNFLERMANATVCVCLSLSREGFFLPPLEAMALGRGVVMSECESSRDYCRPDENCLTRPLDAEAFAGAVLGLFGDRGRLHRVASAGRRTAAEFSLSHERAVYRAALTGYLGRR